MPRDYTYEALAEVTSTDQGIGRGQLNAALRDIRAQEPELASDSFLLSDEIHNRARMYRAMFPEVALTPTALSKHWLRVKQDAPKRPGANLTAEVPSRLPPRHQQGLNEARKAMATLWPEE